MSRSSHSNNENIENKHQEIKNHRDSESDSESDNESDNENSKNSTMNMKKVMRLLTSFIDLINQSDLTTCYDTNKTKAALELIKMSKTRNMTKEVTKAMLDGAYWLIICVDTDKYTVERVLNNQRFEKMSLEANLKNLILTSLDS
jgi:hypothetical protein